MSRVESLGRFLFKIRSYSPLPVIAGVLFLLLRDLRHVSAHPSLAAAFLGAGLAACLLGQALRAWVLGFVQNGTSGQNDYLEAVALNTAGPYAHVRNPLYVGNFLICLGLALIAGSLWAGVLGLGFFCFEYAFIVPAEEGFLRGQFGAAFDAYCAQVPRWFPRSTPAESSQKLASSFDWRRALKKEHNPFAAWASGILFLLALRAYVHGGAGARGELIALAIAEAVLIVAYAITKAWKHGRFQSAPSAPPG